MSLDPETLKEGDRITFGGKISKTVRSVHHHLGSGGQAITFTDHTDLHSIDPLWELAELVRPYIPFLETATMCRGLYHVNCDVCTPEKYLKKLKQDVATLEAAGLKEDE